MGNCSNCVFKYRYQDMSCSFDVCELYDDLGKAANACDNSNELKFCKYKITKEKLIKHFKIKVGDSNE